MRFYRNFYHPGNTVLVVVGDVDPDEAMSRDRVALRRAAGRRADAHSRAGRGGSRRDSAIASGRATSGRRRSRFGWRTPPTLDDATPGLDLLGTILGAGRASRLYRDVRERKLASAVSAYDYTPTSLGVFVVHAETPPEYAADAARAIWAQLRDVREIGVGEARARAREARLTRRAGSAGSRTWRGRRTISPIGNRSATGRWATTTCAARWR